MQSMKSILVTYPNFQSLPKGIKSMLVISESDFFRDVKTSRLKRGTRSANRFDGLYCRRPYAPASSWKN